MKVRFNHQNGFVLDGRVFCEVYGIAENESNDELLNLGWLPSVEEKNIWYQSRSYRIELSNFVISKKRRYIIKKLNCEVNDDDEGLIHWVDRLNKGENRQGVENFFRNAALKEEQKKAPNKTLEFLKSIKDKKIIVIISIK